MNKIKKWLIQNDCYENTVEFNIKGSNEKIPIEIVLKGMKKRISVNEALIILNKLKEQSSLFNLKKEILYFIKDMGANEVYKNNKDYTINQVAKYHNVSPSFILWFGKKRDLTINQLTCDHENSMQYSTDGYFYDIVNRCRKCLIQSSNLFEEQDDLDSMYLKYNLHEKI